MIHWSSKKFASRTFHVRITRTYLYLWRHRNNTNNR